MNRATIAVAFSGFFFLFTALVQSASYPAAGADLSDDFNDNSTNTHIWTVAVVGTGPIISEINNRVEIEFAPSSANDPSRGIFYGEYLSRCAVSGNFDARIDFVLLDWPYQNGIRTGLAALGVVTYGMERTSFGPVSDFPTEPREAYLRDFDQGAGGFTATTDQSGTLRIVRTGSVLTGYYLSGSDWIALPSQQVSTGDAMIRIFAWSHSNVFAGMHVKMAFDNFMVSADGISCPFVCVSDADCDDLNPCTDDSCNPAGECVHT